MALGKVILIAIIVLAVIGVGIGTFLSGVFKGAQMVANNPIIKNITQTTTQQVQNITSKLPTEIPSIQTPAKQPVKTAGAFELSTTSNLPLQMTSGQSTQITVIVSGTSNSGVTLTSSSPSGITSGFGSGTISPNVVPTGSSNLIISIAKNVSAGPYHVIVTGNDGTATKTLDIAIQIK